MILKNINFELVHIICEKQEGNMPSLKNLHDFSGYISIKEETGPICIISS